MHGGEPHAEFQNFLSVLRQDEGCLAEFLGRRHNHTPPHSAAKYSPRLPSAIAGLEPAAIFPYIIDVVAAPFGGRDFAFSAQWYKTDPGDEKDF
jgi:hypothetical protein